MMEVLMGDSLVEKINRTHKKISIKHYLNVYLFPTGEDKFGKPRYPLYYRVIFNKQSVKIKSAINTSFSLSEFKQLNDEQIILIRREALGLTNIVSSIYRNAISAYTGTEKEGKSKSLFLNNEYSESEIPNGEEEVKQDFDINQIFNAFDYSHYELPNLVEQKLIESMANYAKHINHFEEYKGIFKQSNGLNSYQLLQFLINQNSEWKKFEKKHHPLIWFFNLYYYQFTSQCQEYKSLGATQIDFQFLDFQKTFLEHYQTEEFKEVIINIYKIINN